MLRIAVCDDEKRESDYITALVNEWAEGCGIKTEITVFFSAEEFLFKYEEDKNFDILLLDIQMKEMDGIELAEKIRESDKSVQIVFITGFTDYISRGYDVSALHYLIKPVEKDRLFSVLNKADDNLRKTEKFILLTVDNESFKVKLKDIIYIEAFGHSCCVVCNNRDYEVKSPISDFSKMLDESFVRCHRSYVANLRNVSRITKTDVVFDNGKSIPVSRRMYGDVNIAFINYYRGANQ
ncbi:MAG: response regulator transcription factor [Clostridia bacterium]|nr:response regulator transcription factor [Clostridia bacterium]